MVEIFHRNRAAGIFFYNLDMIVELGRDVRVPILIDLHSALNA